MACSLLLQEKKREVSGHPITVGQTRGGHGGRLSPSCLAASSLSRGWAEGFPQPLMPCPTPATPRSGLFIPLYMTKQEPDAAAWEGGSWTPFYLCLLTFIEQMLTWVALCSYSHP